MGLRGRPRRNRPRGRFGFRRHDFGRVGSLGHGWHPRLVGESWGWAGGRGWGARRPQESHIAILAQTNVHEMVALGDSEGPLASLGTALTSS